MRNLLLQLTFITFWWNTKRSTFTKRTTLRDLLIEQLIIKTMWMKGINENMISANYKSVCNEINTFGNNSNFQTRQ
jgi:hypothetical protein